MTVTINVLINDKQLHKQAKTKYSLCECPHCTFPFMVIFNYWLPTLHVKQTQSAKVASPPMQSRQSAVSTSLLKLKFKSSIESIKKFFNFGGWKRLPAEDDGENEEDENQFIESDSLIASYQSLPLESQKYQQQINYKLPVRRIVKELIDDEVPLINL